MYTEKKSAHTEGLKAAENRFLFLEKEKLRCVVALEETHAQEAPRSSIREP